MRRLVSKAESEAKFLPTEYTEYAEVRAEVGLDGLQTELCPRKTRNDTIVTIADAMRLNEDTKIRSEFGLGVSL